MTKEDASSMKVRHYSAGKLALAFELCEGFEVFYSNKILVAFKTGERILVTRNQWKRTTGKHLNSVDGGTKEMHALRVDHDTLLLELKKELKQRKGVNLPDLQ